jgi:hypothetical protein
MWKVIQVFYRITKVPIANIEAEAQRNPVTPFDPVGDISGATPFENAEQGALLQESSEETVPVNPDRLWQEWQSLPKEQQKSWREWLANEFFNCRRKKHPIGPGARNATRNAMSTLIDVLPRLFYFAYQADTRGRLYPVASTLHPHGDDLNRSLLEFADPLPLTYNGVRALAIYGSQQIDDTSILAYSNQHNRVKPTLDDRVAWIEAHTELIVKSARAPLLESWWRGCGDKDAAKVKKPYTFLAFCFAWADYQDRGEDVLCGLPVHVDGTCNGLQHIAALMRDKPLAQATNVLPGPEPRDIYNELAIVVRDQMLAAPTGKKPHQKMKKNDTENPEGNKSIKNTLHDDASAIDFLKKFPLLIDRKMAKGVVMIIPYGAGKPRYQVKIASVAYREDRTSRE